MFSFIRNLASLTRSRKPRIGAAQPRAHLLLESLEAREVRSNGVGPTHNVADSAADQYENMALQSNVPSDIASDLLKGLEALRAQDHPVDGFYNLEYYFANLAHDYQIASSCYINAIANAAYWMNYDPSVKGSGSDRFYGIWDGAYAQQWRDYARNQVDLSYTTPLSSTIAGWWHIGTGPGWVYISPTSATQVTLYVYADGANYSGEVTLDEQANGNFYRAFNTSLTSAFSITFDDRDSANLAARSTTDGSHVDFTLTRYYA